MANFVQDNSDLQFYLQEWIDWETLYALVEIRDPSSDSDAPENALAAKEMWTEIIEEVGIFAADEIAPYSAELDREAVHLDAGEVVFPERLESIFQKMAEFGLHGLCVPRELGGLNNPFMSYLIQGELISRADVSVMTHHSFHGGMALAMIMYSVQEGSTEFDVQSKMIIKTRFDREIKEIINGDAWGCMDITESDAGSDMGALRTRAKQDDQGRWFLTGQKIFVTSGHGRYHFVICRTEVPDPINDPAGLKSLSLFMVETFVEEDGQRKRLATIERIEEKLGHHASATVTINLDETPAQLVGQRGDGFKQMLLLMNNARIGVGFEALGLCEAAWRMAKSYAVQRKSMGKTIDKHELVAHMLEEMQTSIEGLRALCMEAAFVNEVFTRKQMMLQFLKEEGTAEYQQLAAEVQELKAATRLLTPLVKLTGSETAVRLARMAIQIHGGFGYTTEYGAEKLLRDALVLPIYEGTTQIQALMATKDNLLAVTKAPGQFMMRLFRSWRQRLFGDSLGKRVAALRHRSLVAMRALMIRIIKEKWRMIQQDPKMTLSQGFKQWDLKKDFAPALLHAENLSWLLSDAATAEALWKQVQKYPKRKVVLERFLDLSEPRSYDKLHRIRYTGDRLLSQLKKGY